MKGYEICIAPERECPAGRAGFEIDVLVIDSNPLPRSRIGLSDVFPGWVWGFLFSTKLFVAIDAIDGKLIRARRKQSLRIMRASAVRHFSAAFFRCGKGMAPEEARPQVGKRYLFPPKRKGAPKSVMGTHAFSLLASVPK